MCHFQGPGPGPASAGTRPLMGTGKGHRGRFHAHGSRHPAVGSPLQRGASAQRCHPPPAWAQRAARTSFSDTEAVS